MIGNASILKDSEKLPKSYRKATEKLPKKIPKSYRKATEKDTIFTVK
jgi:hypothetical protein